VSAATLHGTDKQRALARIGEEWLIAILRGDTADETEAGCEALIEGGAALIEVAFTTPGASGIIEKLATRHGNRIVVSAGTVLTVDQAREAVDHGAQAIVAPNLYAPVVEYARSRGVIAMPGCVTPTEVADALRLGADLIKLFPIYNLGPEYIGFLRGPYPGVRVVPAGCVTLENMETFWKAGAFAGVIGVTTEMRLLEAVKARDHRRIAATMRAHIDKVKELRARLPRTPTKE
jgi:2-dehydro-3-deoxyphosphogluconate aldolase / (4S)-4-hydroxy-2-oxoglutarate aldolase